MLLTGFSGKDLEGKSDGMAKMYIFDPNHPGDWNQAAVTEANGKVMMLLHFIGPAGPGPPSTCSQMMACGGHLSQPGR